MRRTKALLAMLAALTLIAPTAGLAKVPSFSSRWQSDYNAWAAKTSQPDRISRVSCTLQAGLEYCIVVDHFTTNGTRDDADICGGLVLAPKYVRSKPRSAIKEAVQGSCTAPSSALVA